MKRALLAEDDPTSRVFLTDVLSLSGWEVAAYANGEDAAAAAIAQRFDVLLLDLNLPGIDGIQTLRRIRNLDSHASADSPALALTADDRPQLHHDLRQRGFELVATKPLSVAQLQQALAALGFTDVRSPSAETASAVGAKAQDSPIWNDTQALAMVGGKSDILSALRQLMLADLPGQRDQVLAAHNSDAARTALHRLRAACGFCGAARLLETVLVLERLPAEDDPSAALKAFAHAVEQTLSASQDGDLSSPRTQMSGIDT